MRNAARQSWRGRTRRAKLAAAVACAVTAGCADDPQKPPVDPCAERPCDVAAVVAHLSDAYRRRDYAHFVRLLHDDFRFILHPDPNAVPPPPTGWGKTEELRIHRRMFEPQNIPPGEEPLDRDLWLMAVNIALTGQAFEERPEFYRSASNPDGLDPARWKAWGADYDTAVLFETEGRTDYQVTGRAWFVVVQDLTKAADQPSAFVLYRWQDLGDRLARAYAVDRSRWGSVKEKYRPRRCGEPCNPEALVAGLRDAYAGRDYGSYTRLFHDDFLFILHEPDQPANWGKTEELRIHRRMFEPQNIPPSEPPLSPELWLASTAITLTPAQAFGERPEFYRSPSNPEGLDPARWKAWGADYDHSVLFETQGETHYQATGRTWFVVVQDLTKPLGEPGQFWLYRWQDLGARRAAGTMGVEPSTWSTVKRLYKG